MIAQWKTSTYTRSYFSTPVRASINWKDIESLFKAFWAKIEEGRGSRIRVLLNEEAAVFHSAQKRIQRSVQTCYAK